MNQHNSRLSHFVHFKSKRGNAEEGNITLIISNISWYKRVYCKEFQKKLSQRYSVHEEPSSKTIFRYRIRNRGGSATDPHNRIFDAVNPSRAPSFGSVRKKETDAEFTGPKYSLAGSIFNFTPPYDLRWLWNLFREWQTRVGTQIKLQFVPSFPVRKLILQVQHIFGTQISNENSERREGQKL